MKQDSEGFAWQREGGEEERAQRLPHRFSFSPVPVNRAAWYHSSASRVCFKKQNKHSRQSPLLIPSEDICKHALTHSPTSVHTHPSTLSHCVSGILWKPIYFYFHKAVCVTGWRVTTWSNENTSERGILGRTLGQWHHGQEIQRVNRPKILLMCHVMMTDGMDNSYGCLVIHSKARDTQLTRCIFCTFNFWGRAQPTLQTEAGYARCLMWEPGNYSKRK